MRKKSPPETGSDLSCRFLFVFALLVCNTTRSFASRLTGCLAFATAAVFNTCSQITGIQCLNVFHVYHPFAFTDVFSFKTYLFVFYHKKCRVSSLNQKNVTSFLKTHTNPSIFCKSALDIDAVFLHIKSLCQYFFRNPFPWCNKRNSRWIRPKKICRNFSKTVL